jgi:hypothetical protein
MINNLQQEVILKSLADAVKILPVPADFYMLQNLIIGNVLKPQANIVGSREEDLFMDFGKQRRRIITGRVLSKIR